jgi:hypothetical protein
VSIPAGLEAVAGAFAALFTVDTDEFVLRRSTVSHAVARYLGQPWSPILGARVHAVVVAAGGRAIVLQALCYARLRPRARPGREEALAMSRALRRRAKRIAGPAPDELEAARAALGKP